MRVLRPVLPLSTQAARSLLGTKYIYARATSYVAGKRVIIILRLYHSLEDILVARPHKIPQAASILSKKSLIHYCGSCLKLDSKYLVRVICITEPLDAISQYHSVN